MRITDRIYRTKNDIPYLALLVFGKEIKGNETDVDFVAKKIKEHFKTTDFVAFEKALHKDPKKIKFRYKTDIDLSTATKFIDADIFQNENDIEALLRLFVKRKYRFQKVDVNKISYSEAEFIIKSFLPSY